ncbi:MAG: NADH dehydrogenase (quinone) subunit D [Planctomycetota bacterium]
MHVERSVEDGGNMFLNMGPSHPSTHGVLRIVLEMDGESCVRADPDIGYLHRGMEKIAENYGFTKFIPYTDRMDYLAPVANNIAVCGAAENLMGIELTPRAQAIRVVCCELSRISAHLLGLGAFAMDIGALTVFLYTFREREVLYNLFEALCGARFTVSYPRIGGLSRDLPPGWKEAALEVAREMPKRIESDVEKLLSRNKIWIGRLEGVGVIPRDIAISYGLTGPNLRGSGVQWDLRKERPYFGYENYEFDVPTGTTGDAYDRYLCRVEEIKQSARIVTQALENLPDGPINVEDGKTTLPPKDEVLSRMEQLIHQFMIVTEGPKAPVGANYWGHENPKGERGFYIEGDGTARPYRLRMRAPSFVNLSILPYLLPGNLLSDVVAILASLDFVMGECDR